MRKILFLCTGNYYRSRFAEILFNHLATKKNLDWRAFSRGLKQTPTSSNIGPVSFNTVRYLIRKGIFSSQFLRFPKIVQRSDFETADLTIALKESEHRDYMKSHFPDLEGTIDYWSIDDVDVAPPDKVLPDLEIKIVSFIDNFESGK